MRINLPFVQGTNLVEKYLETVVINDATPCHSPLASSSLLNTSETVTFNGIVFLKEMGGDGGAGHFHDWVAYSVLKDGHCISMDFILHSLNAGNFDPPKPVFDAAAESAVFTQIMSTFTMLTTSSTPMTSIQNVVDALNAHNFDAVKAFMNEAVVFAFHQSQATVYTPDAAIEQLQLNYIGTALLTPDPNKDLNTLLNGIDPYSIVGLNPSNSEALFVSGWGLNGNDEAILFATRVPNGNLYWHSVLIAPGGFAVTP